MRTRLLSLAIVGVFSLSAQAQLASDRFSPINYIGRFAGFGYSDGYHACKDSQCTTRGSWKNWDPMGVTYASPASPPPRTMDVRTMAAPSQQTIANYYDMQHSAEPVEIGTPSSQQVQQSPQVFQPPAQPTHSQPPQWNSGAPKSTIEAVPPAPVPYSTIPQSLPLRSSPSDMRKLETAPPRLDTLPPPSSAPSKPPKETRSIIKPSAFRFF